MTLYSHHLDRDEKESYVESRHSDNTRLVVTVIVRGHIVRHGSSRCLIFTSRYEIIKTTGRPDNPLL